ncbi:hypothetical protein [Microvirga sp. 2TAF3]|uniref:hypothetical protein n=1 Tax=Microvirga sp. 2TAF3 TaxID=3233014 RepID=UPI003F95EDC3
MGEFIGAERGIGKLIVEAEARANASEMMVGILFAIGVRRIQAHLLRWQPQFDQASA